MSLINNIRYFPTKSTNPQKAILMCGFGGAIWQTRRLTTVLNRAGYDVVALDFPKDVLSKGDPTLLPRMVDEVVVFVENEAQKTDQKILLIGISLGSLLSLNILRRSSKFNKAVMITGGNIATVAQSIFGREIWPQNHANLSKLWQDVNIFTEPELLKDKRAVFVLPTRDKLIDTTEVITEITRQNENGNHLVLVKRNSFGHVGTIIEETILFPKRILTYIDRL
jgi:pimeloyl-ACP methyl ester carboxylesterase